VNHYQRWILPSVVGQRSIGHWVNSSSAPTLSGCFWPILLKKPVIQSCLIIDRRKRLFYTLLFKIRFWTPQPKVKDFNVGRVLFSCGNRGRLFSTESANSRRSTD